MASYLPVLMDLVDTDLLKTVALNQSNLLDYSNFDTNNLHLKYNFEKFVSLFENINEWQEFINSLIKNDDDLSKVLESHSLTDRHFKELVQIALEKNLNLNSFVLIKAYKNGILSAESLVLQVNKTPPISDELMKLLKVHDIPLEIREEFKEAYLNSIIDSEKIESSSFNPEDIRSTLESGIMSETEYMHLFSKLLESNRDGYLYYLLACQDAGIDWHVYISKNSLIDKLKEPGPLFYIEYKDTLIKLGLISLEEIKEVVSNLDSNSLLSNLWRLSYDFKSEELAQQVRQAFFSLSLKDKEEHIYNVFEYLSSEEALSVINELLNNGVSMFPFLLNSSWDEKLGPEKVSEMMDKSFRNALNNPSGLDINKIIAYIEIIEDESNIGAASEILLETWENVKTVSEAIALIVDLGYMMKAEDVRLKLDRFLVEDGYLVELIDQHRAEVALREYYEVQEIEDIYSRYIKINPAKALSRIDQIKRVMSDISEEKIIKEALANETVMNAIGVYLEETFVRFQKTDKNGTKEALLAEAAIAYKMFGTLVQSGLQKLIIELHSGEITSASQEFDLLEKVFVASQYCKKELLSDVDSVEVLNARIFEGLLSQVG